jgi:hypothetical protein
MRASVDCGRTARRCRLLWGPPLHANAGWPRLTPISPDIQQRAAFVAHDARPSVTRDRLPRQFPNTSRSRQFGQTIAARVAGPSTSRVRMKRLNASRFRHSRRYDCSALNCSSSNSAFLRFASSACSTYSSKLVSSALSTRIPLLFACRSTDAEVLFDGFEKSQIRAVEPETYEPTVLHRFRGLQGLVPYLGRTRGGGPEQRQLEPTDELVAADRAAKAGGIGLQNNRISRRSLGMPTRPRHAARSAGTRCTRRRALRAEQPPAT